jgi:hypothetical protein
VDLVPVAKFVSSNFFAVISVILVCCACKRLLRVRVAIIARAYLSSGELHARARDASGNRQAGGLQECIFTQQSTAPI